ncbi:unnamed protein product, partial [Schistosoma margrebowiei]
SSTNSPAPSKSTYPNESDSPYGVSDDHRHSFPHTTTTNVFREPIKEEDEELEDEPSGKDLKENKVNDETNVYLFTFEINVLSNELSLSHLKCLFSYDA